MSLKNVRVAIFAIEVSAVLAVAGRPALAEDANHQADKLIKHGIELRRRLDDDGAVREFQKAYDLVHTPRAAAQLGLAEQALGRWEDAERHLNEALAATDDPWVTKNRDTLQQSLAAVQPHVGRVEVTGDPVGAAVSVNGRSVGELPLPEAVLVSAGQVGVRVSAEGYLSEERSFSLVGGQYQRIAFHLVKVPEPGVAVTPTTPPATNPVSPTTPAPADEGPSETRRVLKWTAAGMAGAGLVTGIVGTVLHSHNASSFTNQGCFNDNGKGVDRNGTPIPACQSALDATNTDQTLEIVGFAAAGAFAITFLVLQLTEPSSSGAPAEQASRWPVCGPSPTGFGISCQGRF
ncbi:MAG TPA: PEGA domain-containing protein [Polyangia bacterium]|nr:PEGA domain-containing protein [Polyangia bacterium]